MLGRSRNQILGCRSTAKRLTNKIHRINCDSTLSKLSPATISRMALFACACVGETLRRGRDIHNTLVTAAHSTQLSRTTANTTSGRTSAMQKFCVEDTGDREEVPAAPLCIETVAAALKGVERSERYVTSGALEQSPTIRSPTFQWTPCLVSTHSRMRRY